MDAKSYFQTIYLNCFPVFLAELLHSLWVPHLVAKNRLKASQAYHLPLQETCFCLHLPSASSFSSALHPLPPNQCKSRDGGWEGEGHRREARSIAILKGADDTGIGGGMVEELGPACSQPCLPNCVCLPGPQRRNSLFPKFGALLQELL